MGRLRDRRRGGGPARTITGLNREGTATKVMGNKGGIQYPIVGEVGAGTIVEVNHPVSEAPIQTPVGPRRTACLLMELDWTVGGEISETNPPQTEFGFTLRNETLITWTHNAACTMKFWVF